MTRTQMFNTRTVKQTVNAGNDGQDSTDRVAVVIVGAGPTGALLAIELARRGVEVRVLDKQHSRPRESRALGLHALTLEVFHRLGLRRGVPRAGPSTHRNEARVMSYTDPDSLQRLWLRVALSDVETTPLVVRAEYVDFIDGHCQPPVRRRELRVARRSASGAGARGMVPQVRDAERVVHARGPRIGGSWDG
jgi:flavin-dependent dehydrogenase